MKRFSSLAGGLALISGLLASALPAVAAQGAPTAIRLLDANLNGKIDRAVVTVDNPSQRAWQVRGGAGFKAWYGAAEITVADAFVASAPTANPVSLEIVFDENDADLPVDTSAAQFEVEYASQGVGRGADDGVTELAAFAKGDNGPSDTESDAAAPILISSDPIHASIEVDRDHVVVLGFSEPISPSSFAFTSAADAAGWLPSWNAQGTVVSLSHINYGSNDRVTFTVTSTRDLAENALAFGTRVPNPFRFRVSSNTTSEPRPDTNFELFLPPANGALPAGAATMVAWSNTLPDVQSVRLSSSVNGTAYAQVHQGPVGAGAYAWYPPVGSVTLKLEGLSANGAVFAVDTRGPLTFTAGAASALRVVAPAEIVSASVSSAELRFKTDARPADVRVSCDGAAPTMTHQVSGDRPATISVSLGQLVSDATYACRADLTDALGNASRVDFPTVTASTPSLPSGDAAITAGPVVDRFDPATKTARLTWTTSAPTVSSVSYGQLNDYSGLAAESTASTTHELTLTNLLPGAMHQARITSTDAAGKSTVSKDHFFIFLSDGTRVKGSGPAVYWYLGGKRYVFPNETVYASWFADFLNVMRIPDTQLAGIPIGGNVQMHAGTWLVKIQSDPKVYAVEPGGTLRWVQTESHARALYGADWAKHVRDLDVSLFAGYTIGEALAEGAFHQGYMARTADGAAWHVSDDRLRRSVVRAGLEANHYARAAYDLAALFRPVDEGSSAWTRLTVGTPITAYEAPLNVVRAGLSAP